MRIKINREQPFQVLATNFSIGPSSSGYDLQISADGVNFTTLFSVGANVTRMVTGVANGSTYRLQYNTDEDVIVNWERQCNDGGSGGAGTQGPQGEQGPQGYQGAEGAQGPQGQDGIDQDPTLLKSVSELPATADTGDVVALSVEGSGLPNGITFVEREYDGGLQGRRLTVPFNSLDDLGDGELLFIGKVGPEGSLYDLNLSFAGLANNYYLAYEDPYDPMLSVFLEPATTTTDAINGVIFALDFTDSAYTVDMYPDTTVANEIEFSDIPEGTSQVGVYQYDGTNWNAIGGGAGGGVVYLDTLSGVTGEENTIYECDSHLWTWNNSGGTCAEWSNSITQYIDSPRGFGLIFSHIPDGQTILGFRYRYNNKAWRYIKMSGNTLVLTEEDGTTIVNSCTYGQDKKFEGSYAGGNYYVNVRYQKHYLGVEIKDSIETKDVWSGTAAGGHFEIVDHSNYPYLTDAFDGIPNWNSKGEIIGKKYSVDVKAMYANNTGYSNSTNFMVQNAGSFPNRMFVPTQSGVAGQVLLSAGNGEPQWSNWIKCVKITSDAYEALQDKDPNTLYLIDDE